MCKSPKAVEMPDREYEGLKEFAGEFGRKVDRLQILTKDYEAKNGEIACIPLWKWLLEREKGECP